MTDQEFVLETLRKAGRTVAEQVQAEAPGMTGTALNGEAGYLPDFAEAVKVKNMLERKAGQRDGFVCKAPSGRVVRLIQNYDSTVYTQEPEGLPAQWAFVWSQDPAQALPFVALSTSPYGKGDCCTHNGHVWRSGQDGNVWAPGTLNVKWEDLGAI